MLKNKVVIVTGASQGLGKDVSKRIAEMGARVALVSRNESLLKKVQDEIKSLGGEAEVFVCDVTVFEQVNKTVNAILEKFGTIDVLVNGAGIWTTEEFEALRPELVEQAFKVNSIGPIYFTKAVLPVMKKNNYGTILNVVSKAGLDISENKDWMTYAATKWAVAGFTNALRYALEETKIKVTAIYPGGFESNIFETAGEKEAHDQPWMMRTSDVTEAIVYALNTPDDLLVNTIGLAKK